MWGGWRSVVWLAKVISSPDSDSLGWHRAIEMAGAAVVPVEALKVEVSALELPTSFVDTADRMAFGTTAKVLETRSVIVTAWALRRQRS